MDSIVGLFPINAFIRALGLLVLLPFENLPSALLSRSIVALLLALSAPESNTQLHGVWLEFLIGVLIALPAVLVLQVANWFAEFFDLGRGQSMAEQYDPLLPGSGSALATLFYHYTWACLLLLGYWEHLLRSYYNSFQILSPQGLMSPAIETIFSAESLNYISSILSGGMLILCPLFLLYFVTDSAFVVVGRFFPRLMCYAEAYVIRSILGFSFLYGLYRLDLPVSLFGVATHNPFFK